MTTTISRLYNSYGDARAAVQQLEVAGVPHEDIGIIASNADNWYSKTARTRSRIATSMGRTTVLKVRALVLPSVRPLAALPAS